METTIDRPLKFSIDEIRDWCRRSYLYTITLDATALGHTGGVDFLVFNENFLSFVLELGDYPSKQFGIVELISRFADAHRYGHRDISPYGSSLMPWPKDELQRYEFSKRMFVNLLIDMAEDDDHRSLVLPFYKTTDKQVRRFCKKNFTKYRVGTLGKTILYQDPHKIKVTKDVLTFMNLTGDYKCENLIWEGL